VLGSESSPLTEVTEAVAAERALMLRTSAGWYGEPHPRAAWLLAQHAADDLDFQRRCLVLLEQAVHWFYPGHGKDSTLGTERPSLPEWRARGW
jgi:hypothetical protein